MNSFRERKRMVKIKPCRTLQTPKARVSKARASTKASPSLKEREEVGRPESRRAAVSAVRGGMMMLIALLEVLMVVNEDGRAVRRASVRALALAFLKLLEALRAVEGSTRAGTSSTATRSLLDGGVLDLAWATSPCSPRRNRDRGPLSMLFLRVRILSRACRP